MTIYEMLFREDIYGIIEKTLEEYYTTVQNKTVSVRVERNTLRNGFVIYPRLGVVVSRVPSANVMRDIYGQFNVQGNWKRKLVAWGYITLMFATLGIFAPKSLRTSDKSVLKRDIYIMPCNRKLRIFDYSKGIVDAILKVGFNDAYFKNELKYRVNPKFDFIPPVLANGDRWYRESIIKGSGLVRMPQAEYDNTLNKVCQEVRTLYMESPDTKNAEEYTKPLADYILSKLDYLKQKKNVMSTDYIAKVVWKAMDFVKGVEVNVPLVLSHGDLQTGNIIYDAINGQAYIYDWETAGKRSIWYDAGRLLLYSQRQGKYAYMIEHREESSVKEKILFFDSRKDYPMTVVISVLVLEELQAFVDEICDLPGAIGTEIMDRLTDELKRTALFA